MDACNLDTGGVRKRRIGGFVALTAGVGLAAWQIQAGHPLAVRLAAAFVLFAFGALSLVQARAKT